MGVVSFVGFATYLSRSMKIYLDMDLALVMPASIESTTAAPTCTSKPKLSTHYLLTTS